MVSTATRDGNSSKETRVEQAYRRIRDEILSNRLPPGFTALESELAERLDFSRTPVREALIRLEAEGLVRVIPRHGMRVERISPTDLREIYEILTALEPEAARKIAAMRPPRAQLEELEAACSDMELAIERKDLEAWAAADDRFHRLILALADNRRMEAFLSTLYDQAHRARLVTLPLRQLPTRSTEDHREILNHIANGDTEGAFTSFREHRKRAARELLNVLESTNRLTVLQQRKREARRR